MNEKDLFSKYVTKMESIDDTYFKKVNTDLFNGQNSYLRMRMRGSSFFNDEWIRKIEDCIYELGQIVNNPAEVTTTEGSITPIELAKKINYESVQHLASHTQYIKDIDENGNVIPAKILSQFHKEELHTYENRFIATFIRRLVLFVEKRYEFIRSTVNFDTKEILYMKNKSVVDGQEVEIETKVTLKKENDDTESKIGKEYVERVEKMRTYVNYFYNSPFMKELKTEKDVRKPILQTNIIRKNPLYHKCYETFLFIERFNSLGVEYTSDESYKAFSEKERKELNYIFASNLMSLGLSEKSHPYKASKKVYKPRLLSSIDDEAFLYGDLVKGPINFVRADEKYLEYLDKKVKLNTPPRKLTKIEREYFKDRIDALKEDREEIKNIEALLKRIQREIAKWEKIVAELIAERNVEEAKEAEAHLEELRKEEADVLAKKRAAIIAAALEDKKDSKVKKSENKKASKPVQVKVEEPKAEVIPVVEEPKVEEVPVAQEVIVEEPKVEAAPVVEEKKDEAKPKTKKAPSKKVTSKKTTDKKQTVKKTPAKKPAQVKADNKETKKVEEKPVVKKVTTKKSPSKVAKKVEPKKEEKAEPKKVEKKPEISQKVKEKPVILKKKSPKKHAKKPVKKETHKETSKPKPETKNILEVIPGKFIVKTPRGYVKSERTFANLKSQAMIFNDFNKARRFKELYGGKVIKL